MKKLMGFSLLELMVVVAILGVLATVAVPRFNIFRARARQAESKSNMGVIYTLQEAFQIEHESFYNGDGTAWQSPAMEITSRSGLDASGATSTCAANKLGFRIANCDKARYGYYIDVGATNETEWLAVAHAPSASGRPEYRIFPGCDGAGSALAPGSSPGNIKCVRPGSGNDHSSGDAWCIDEGRNLENYRDITEFCDN